MRDAVAGIPVVHLPEWNRYAVAAAIADHAAPVPRVVVAPEPAGLSIRIGTRGATWSLRVRVRGGRQTTVSIGPVVPDLVAEVVARAVALKADAAKGTEPDDDRLRVEYLPLGNFTVAFCARLAAKSREFRRRNLVRAIGPLVGRSVATITREDLQARLDAIQGPAAKHRAAADIRQLFKFLVEADILGKNPAAALKAERPKPRQTVHAIRALRLVYRLVDELDPALAAFFRFQSLAGARRSEVRYARVGEFDLASRTWRLPAERAKNGWPHLVHLSRPALAIVQERIAAMPVVTRDALVFGKQVDVPLASDDLTALTKWANATLGLAERDKAARFTLHDLRRCWVQIAVSHGIEAGHADRALNHVASGTSSVVQRTYLVSEHWPQRRAATAIVGRILAEGEEAHVVPDRESVKAFATRVEAFWETHAESSADDPEGPVEAMLVPVRGGLRLVGTGPGSEKKTEQMQPAESGA
jgi:integrase